MSERSEAIDTQPMQSAGGMLRAARQAQGLHLAALATQLKISPRKLEALEADRFDELQGITFVRALAQAACRALKIDPAPVLARLPQQEISTLEQVSGGLNAPFREHGATRAPLEWLNASRMPLLAVAALLLGALLLWLAPPGFGLSGLMASDAEPPLGAASAPASESPPVAAEAPQSTASLPAVEAAIPNPTVVADGSAATPAASSAMALQVLARESSWVEVIDANGRSLIARTLSAGEAVGLDGGMPLRVKIGNAAATELHFRGQLVDLAASTRDNIARLELK